MAQVIGTVGRRGFSTANGRDRPTFANPGISLYTHVVVRPYPAPTGVVRSQQKRYPSRPPSPPQTPTALTPQTSTRGQGTMDAVAGSSSGVVLSETQLGNMALRAKQQRFKAEQDRQLLQVCCLAAHDLRNAWSVLI